MLRITPGKIFKAVILIGISAFWWLPVEHRASVQSAVNTYVTPHIPEVIREKLSLEKPKRFFAERLPSAERALDASRGATRSLIDMSLSPEQRVAALNKIAFESKGLAREIRTLIETDFPGGRAVENAGNAHDPHSLAAYRRNFEVRIRMMALELYRGAELDVKLIHNQTLRWLAEVRQSGGSVDQTINKMTGTGERTNFMIPPSPDTPEVNVCPSAEELAAVSADFRFMEPRGEEEITWVDADLSRCDRKLVAAVAFLRTLSAKLEPASADLFDADNLAGNPYEFTRARIKTIRFETEDTAPNCLNVGVVAFFDPAIPNAIRVCPYAEKLPSALMAAHLLVHEARHIDGHPHVLCTQGELENQFSFACDESYEGGGSYAVGAEFYVKVARAEKINVELRREARHLALIDFLNRFNDLPFNLRKGALLKTTKGSLYFFDGTGLAPILQESPELQGAWRLALRSGLATFFHLAEGWVRGYEFAPVLVETEGDFARDFGARLAPPQRQKFLDAHFGRNYACLLFTGELRCGLAGEKDIVRPLQRLKAVGFLHTPKSSVVPGDTLFLVGAKGELYQLPRVFAELELLNEAKLKPATRENYHLRALVPWLEGFELGLRTDGTAWIFAQATKKWTPAQRLAPYRFETLVGPLYWSPDLELLK